MSQRPPRTAAGTALGVVAAAGAAAFAWGSIVERNRFGVRVEVLPILAPGSKPVRVLHLSDMHMAPWQTGKQAWLRTLAELEPDLVIDTGDNLGHADGLIGIEAALDPLSGIPGVYVHGSNDYFGPVFKNPFNYFLPSRVRNYRTADLDTGALEEYFDETLGWVNLNNAAAILDINGTRFEFFGVNDAHRGWDRLDLLPGELEVLREGEDEDDPAQTNAVSIGVTHAPYRRVLDAFVTYDARAIFAGHTHGGQVRIPGLPALVTNCDIPADQARGLSVWTHAGRRALLNVSAGIGTSIYAPVRFACPPEAVLVELVAADIAPSDIGYS
jgi:predicted MPP superfamily phosphohydrolase